MLKNSSKNEALFVQSLNKYFLQKMNSLPSKKIHIRSLFVLIQFEIDRIVHDRPNIAVTQLEAMHGAVYPPLKYKIFRMKMINYLFNVEKFVKK
jgi:hypothetical protein